MLQFLFGKKGNWNILQSNDYDGLHGIFVQSTILANKMIQYAPGVHVWGFLKFSAIYIQLTQYIFSHNFFFRSNSSWMLQWNCVVGIIFTGAVVRFDSKLRTLWEKKNANFLSKKQFINGLAEDSTTNVLARRNSIHVFFSLFIHHCECETDLLDCHYLSLLLMQTCETITKNNYAVRNCIQTELEQKMINKKI